MFVSPLQHTTGFKLEFLIIFLDDFFSISFLFVHRAATTAVQSFRIHVNSCVSFRFSRRFFRVLLVMFCKKKFWWTEEHRWLLTSAFIESSRSQNTPKTKKNWKSKYHQILAQYQFLKASIYLATNDYISLRRNTQP